MVHASFIDYLDGYDRGDKTDNWFTLAAGVSLYFGKPADTDKDGIIDSEDKDPLHAEDVDGFQDEDGAPDPDNDMDGVLDVDDQAPLEAEDHDGYKDKDGVPDPDNDGDGILDKDDQCPGTDNNLNTREDKDGFRDDDGCPDPDNDGDGIADADDACPDEAETPNGYEDADGCPDNKPAVAVDKGKSIVLEGVTFATGSAQLTESSQSILDKVAATLLSEQEIEVEIRGYTDNTGNYDKNVALSSRRVEAVKKYLIDRGVAGARIQTRGFGPENPIAPNDTRAGRAKNRRIEFFRIK
ncbi:MAG: OmpA family protein [Calditrichaeota bacterium]|nr:MAG: OmpA family protein [Calditrichota bacterium]